MALITLSRMTELIPNFNSADNTVATDIMNAASETVQRYCNRDFTLTTYDELYDGPGAANLLLNQYPITKILRIAFNETNVMGITQTNTSVQRASFRLDGDSSTPAVPNNLYLVSMLNGQQTTITFSAITTASPTVTINGGSPTTFAQMYTLGDLGTAINTYGGAYGWQSLPIGIYNTWAIADLRPPQGALESRWYGYAYLRMHGWNFFNYDYRPDTGEVVSGNGFQWGYQNYRVIYQAGYTTIPYPIQQATADLAVSVYLQRGVNPNLTSETLDKYSYTVSAETTFKKLDLVSRYGLQLFKNYRIAKYKV